VSHKENMPLNICSVLADFKYSFTAVLGSKFATRLFPFFYHTLSVSLHYLVYTKDQQ